ncbi:methyl-accepting chemotaxis protein [Scytonema sp. NUACC26]|uniref:methyl-accepting chemotaxis protein n=1 Tax=Scytonema sp. NUACC26 TaxID=3140176 RepID=UPI0034DC460C
MLNNKVNISGLQSSQSRLRTKNSQIVKVERHNNKISLTQLFYNLPISSKQFIGLITCELVSVVGIGLGSILIINQGLQTQFLEQAKSELTTTNVNYDSQVNQISSIFREKAVNSTIINAAIAHNSGKPLSISLQKDTKKLLEEEARNRKIEYATLVGRDFKIIANVNSDRQGEIFNPNNLVSEAIEKSQQIVANSVITWSELSQELPSLPKEFKQQDTLIRYTVTPVKDEKTQTVVGALVTGEILSGKDASAKKTVETLGGGYSAIYFRKANGEFALATSLYQDKLNYTKQNFPLPKKALSLLNIVTKNSIGRTVTKHLALGNRTYAIAAKAIPNKIIEGVESDRVPSEEPVAILVRGTPETALDDLLRYGWQRQSLAIFIGLLLISLWTLIVGRAIIKPIKNLQQTAQKFTDGQVSTRSQVFATDEIGQLAMSFNSMADSLAEQNQRRENQAKLEFHLNNITVRIRETLNTETVLKTLVSTTKEAIQADRVVFYRLDANLKGKIVAESVNDSLPAAIGTTVVKPYQIQEDFKQYEIGRVKAVDNIQEISLSQYYLEHLALLSVKAYLISPIYANKQLYGLLVAHQCSTPRQWQVTEIDLFRQIAVQAGYALEQAQLLQQVECGVAASPEELQHKDTLQTQLSELIDNIESAARGDLTVRAEVTVGEIGTVADFFNSIVESLRDIVTKVKESALQVNQAIGSNEGAVRHLAEEAIAQATEIHRTLDAVDNMTISIQAVAASAEQATTVAHDAAHTVTKSGRAMDLTVQQILRLRETISDTTKKVRRLGESTQHISRVVALINQISTQTNLIAINAGLEASRAGEEGQGFVIVAEEVGELAAQTVVATREIEQIVESIQLETTEVVKAMELGTTQVMDGTRIVDDAKQNLNQILDISRQIDLLVRAISEATASQVETSQVVSQLMKAIAATSQRTSDSSRQASNSFAQTLQIAKELQQVVETFQVK